MRKTIFLPVILLGMLLFSSSCKKESRGDNPIATPDETVNVKISANQSYQLNLSNEGTVSISRQALHYSVSETIMDNEKNSPVYSYTPAKGFTGNDEVVLLSTKTSVYSSGGGGCHNGNGGYSTATNSRYITVKIEVGN